MFVNAVRVGLQPDHFRPQTGKSANIKCSFFSLTHIILFLCLWSDVQGPVVWPALLAVQAEVPCCFSVLCHIKQGYSTSIFSSPCRCHNSQLTVSFLPTHMVGFFWAQIIKICWTIYVYLWIFVVTWSGQRKCEKQSALQQSIFLEYFIMMLSLEKAHWRLSVKSSWQ